MNNTLCQGFSVHFSGNCLQVLSHFLELESILAELESNLGELNFFELFLVIISRNFELEAKYQ